MEYPRTYWYASSDETFELGCCFLIPSAFFVLFVITQLFSLFPAIVLGLLVLLGTVALLYHQNRDKTGSTQKVFRTQKSMMSQIVENVLIRKQLPYGKTSKGRFTVYLLNDSDISITVGPYIRSVLKVGGGHKRVEDGVVVKIRSQEPTQDILLTSIKNKIDVGVEPFNLT